MILFIQKVADKGVDLDVLEDNSSLIAQYEQQILSLNNQITSINNQVSNLTNQVTFN